MKVYTREQIQQGFKNWNSYIANGGDVVEYDPLKTQPETLTDALIEFIEQSDTPAFQNDVSTKNQEA